jgi:hypothetical protein
MATLPLNTFNTSITARVLNLLRTNFKTTFTTYYDGDPWAIPTANLPALIVEKQSGTTTAEATGLDHTTHKIQIKIAIDKRQDFMTANNTKTTHQLLQQYYDGRDPVTLEYSPVSLLGILRTNYTINQTDKDQDTFGVRLTRQEISCDFATSVRPNDIMTAELIVTLDLEENVLVPVRT